jgi:ribosomal protein S14
VEIYGRVRRAVRVEGRSERATAREFGISRETVRKMLRYAVPPGYQRQQPIKRPKLEPRATPARQPLGSKEQVADVQALLLQPVLDRALIVREHSVHIAVGRGFPDLEVNEL